jgi:hypothetical protein
MPTNVSRRANGSNGLKFRSIFGWVMIAGCVCNIASNIAPNQHVPRSPHYVSPEPSALIQIKVVSLELFVAAAVVK